MLPTINLPAAVTIPVVPAVEAQTVSAAFISNLNIQADVDPTQPWPMTATLNGLMPDGTYAVDASGNVISQQVSRDLKADMTTYPLVGQTLVTVMEVIAALSVISGIETQLNTQLAAIVSTTQQVAAATALVAQDVANSIDPTADQATLAAQQETLSVLITSAWGTLLGQWRAAATVLGVADPHALPPAMVGLTVPEGVTV